MHMAWNRSTMTHESDSDLLQFSAEPCADSTAITTTLTPWHILVVDDDESVHQVTRLSLKNERILGHPIQLHDAFSSAEAMTLLESGVEFAIILLDVVMETDDAGLKLVRSIRETLKNRDIRVILRTGQPGQAREADAVSKYDINDYRLKTELTRIHLISAITAALRAYEQIKRLRMAQDNMVEVANIANALMQETDLPGYALVAIDGVKSLIQCPGDMMVVRRIGVGSKCQWRCLAAQGSLSEFTDTLLDPTSDRITAIAASTRILGDNDSHIPSTFKVASAGASEFYFVTTQPSPITPLQQQALAVLLVSVRIGFEKQLLIEHLSALAWTDRLTQLPNRAALINALDTAITSASHYDLVVMNLDGFGTINDGLGQEVGDATLKEIARRLMALGDGRWQTARIYGDTFAVLGRSTELTFSRVNAIFADTIKVNHSDIRMAASYGTLHHISSCLDSEDAFRKATMALHRAKRNERGSNVSFAPEMDTEVKERLELARLLVVAIEQQQLELHYQPKIRFSDGKAVAVEALMRWPIDGGFIPPVKFIPVAETSGLIFELERFLVKRACTDYLKLAELGHSDINIAINVSASVLETQAFFSYFKSTIKAHNVPAENLCIELTEGTVSRNQAILVNQLHKYRAIGVKISLDDFGTGYNSLAQLNSLPIDQIKIDKSFVDNILTDERALKLNKAIMLIAKTMALEIVAEGIEYQEQGNTMNELGCDQGQGYWYSRPLPLPTLLDWLKTHKLP